MNKKEICMICDMGFALHNCEKRDTCIIAALCDERDQLKKENKRLRARLKLERIIRRRLRVDKVGTNVPPQPSIPPIPSMVRGYFLGKNSELIFDTYYIPEAIPYYSDILVESISDNHITMTVTLADEEKKKIYMSVEQASAIIEALKMQIDRLGGNK